MKELKKWTDLADPIEVTMLLTAPKWGLKLNQTAEIFFKENLRARFCSLILVLFCHLAVKTINHDHLMKFVLHRFGLQKQ